MKKSIKYAGIAAATLLAVAPVAAPVVSQATIASTTSKNADQSSVDKAVTDFSNQFGDQDASDVTLTSTNEYSALGEGNAQDITTFEKNWSGLIKTVADASKLTLLDKDNQDAYVYVTVTDAKGNLYDGTVGNGITDLKKAISMDSYLPATVNVYMKYKNLSDSKYGNYSKVTSFKLNADDNDELKSVNAKFTTPLTVAKNSKTAATQLVSGSNVSILDQNGDSIATKSVTIPDQYFYTYSAAINSISTPVNGFGDVKTSDISLNDAKTATDEFKSAGTYYQKVTYTANSNSSLATLLNKFTTDPDNYTVYVNGKKASSGYDFVASGDSISFVRAINVSDSEADWTTEDVDGVVTTKSGSEYYTLKNGENAAISNRALAKNTAWKTNAKRTDQNGNVQYRVGADEWIDADNVTFSKGSHNGNGSTTGSYTDVKALNGKVTTAGPAGYVYPLYDDNGKAVSDRAVAGLTSWYTDKSAVNADGTTVYHVATGEWLQGTNVTYTAY